MGRSSPRAPATRGWLAWRQSACGSAASRERPGDGQNASAAAAADPLARLRSALAASLGAASLLQLRGQVPTIVHKQKDKESRNLNTQQLPDAQHVMVVWCGAKLQRGAIDPS